MKGLRWVIRGEGDSLDKMQGTEGSGVVLKEGWLYDQVWGKKVRKEREVVEVDISGGVEVGPFHYEVEVGEGVDKELRGGLHYGETSSQNQTIRLSEKWGEEWFGQTFFHEVIEAIDDVYCNKSLKHEEIVCLGNGLAQAMKSLGVKFVYNPLKG